MHFVVNFSVYGRETKFVAEQAVEPSSPQRRQASPLRPFYVFLQHPASFIMHLQLSPASKARVLQTESAFTTQSCSFSLVSSALLLGTYWGSLWKKNSRTWYFNWSLITVHTKGQATVILYFSDLTARRLCLSPKHSSHPHLCTVRRRCLGF